MNKKEPRPLHSGDIGQKDDVKMFDRGAVHDAKPHVEIPIRATPAISEAPSDDTMLDSLETLGSGIKELMEAINRLERSGIAATVPLPKIVAVGDQSAGKSSLIEAISDIQVPRDSGTCTRCVLQINLRNDPASTWSCRVALVKRYGYIPTESLPGDPLHPWMEFEHPVVTELCTVQDKTHLEGAVRNAQTAALNPGREAKLYAGHVIHDVATQVEFSPNIVSLEITAPNIPNLSFYDLPGIISQSQDGSTDTVRLIEELAKTYVDEESTIVLLAVSMENDINNSKASAIVDRIPGANDRTVGVLTKPDRLPADSDLKIWKAVLEGSVFKKGLGYFVVKQPSPTDLGKGMTHTQAREAEEKFFSATGKWPKKFGVQYQAKLGTAKLQETLSDQLAKLIYKSLPDLREQVHTGLVKVQEELEKLPQPPENPLQIVHRAISDFTTAFRKKIEGSQPNELTDSWRKTKMAFVSSIVEGMRPTMLNKSSDMLTMDTPSKSSTPMKQKTSPLKRKPALTIELSDSEGVQPTSSARATPTKKHKANAQAATPRTSIVKQETTIMPPAIPSRDPMRMRFKLPEIRTTLDRYTKSGIPGFKEPKAVDTLVLQALTPWTHSIETLSQQLHTGLSEALVSTLHETAPNWPKLYARMQEVIDAFLALRLAEVTAFTKRTYQVEMTKPMTHDEENTVRYTNEELEGLRKARSAVRIEAFTAEDADTHGEKRSREEIVSILGPDPYSREVEVMADIRAYYRIASVRFVDVIVQSIEAETFLHLRDGLGDELFEALRVYSADGFDYAKSLFINDPVREQRRLYLKEKQERLEQAQGELEVLNVRFYGHGMGTAMGS